MEEPEAKIFYEWKIVHNGENRTPNIRSSSASFVYKEHFWLICGGTGGLGKSSEVWKFSIKDKTWHKVVCTGDIPAVRDGHSCTYIGNGNFVMFGGQGFPYPNAKLDKAHSGIKTWLVRELFNDMYQFSCDTCVWTVLHPDGLHIPMGRRGHTAIYIGKNFGELPKFNNKVSRDTDADTTTSGYSGSTSFTSRHGGASQESVHGGGGSVGDPRSAASVASASTGGPFGTAPKEQNFINPNSLLVFGGSGIELSKYSELVFNDLWQFCFDTMRWSKIEAEGFEPRPIFDHRVEVIGNMMVVVGGIPGPPKPVITNADIKHRDDLMLLDLRACCWSYLKIRDEDGLPTAFNFHGFSMTSDFEHNPNVLVLFGGRDVVNSQIAASAASKPTTASMISTFSVTNVGENETVGFMDVVATFTLNIVDGILSPHTTTGNTPINRYAHAAASTMGVDAQVTLKNKASSVISEKQQQLLLREKAEKAKAARKRSMVPKSMQEDEHESLMYVYGGCGIERGGFCDPTLYELQRVISYKDASNLLQNMNFAAMAAAVSAGMDNNGGLDGGGSRSWLDGGDVLGGNSPGSSSYGERPRSSGAMAESIFDNAQGSGIVAPSLLPSKHSIWKNQQIQANLTFQNNLAVSMSRSGSMGQSIDLNGSRPQYEVKQPQNWKDLKLALTPPLSMRIGLEALKRQRALEEEEREAMIAGGRLHGSPAHGTTSEFFSPNTGSRSALRTVKSVGFMDNAISDGSWIGGGSLEGSPSSVLHNHRNNNNGNRARTAPGGMSRNLQSQSLQSLSLNKNTGTYGNMNNNNNKSGLMSSTNKKRVGGGVVPSHATETNNGHTPKHLRQQRIQNLKQGMLPLLHQRKTKTEIKAELFSSSHL